MSIESLKASKRIYIEPSEAAEALGISERTLRRKAYNDPGKLGFSVMVTGDMIFIPRLSFLAYLLKDGPEPSLKSEPKERKSRKGVPVSLKCNGLLEDLPIEALNMSLRATNALHRSNISNVKALLEQTDEDLKKLRSVGKKTYEEVRNAISEYDPEWRDFQNIKVRNNKTYAAYQIGKQKQV